MVPGEARWQHREQGLNVGSYSVLYVRKIAMNAPDDADMFGVADKLNVDIVDDNRRYYFLLVNKELLAGGRKNHKFSFLGGENNMVRRTVVKS